MPTKTNKQALEAALKEHLTGTCIEELQTQVNNGQAVAAYNALYQTGKGYFIGQPSHYGNIRILGRVITTWRVL